MTANPEVIQGEVSKAVTAVLNSCMDEIGGSYGIKLKHPPCNAIFLLPSLLMSSRVDFLEEQSQKTLNRR